jgi:regulator of RNase E activity RraB
MSEDRIIPYEHFAFFIDETSALRCADELIGNGYLVTVELDDDEPSEVWALTAQRKILISDLSATSKMVVEIVERHGGIYDGGGTWMLGPDEGIRA